MMNINIAVALSIVLLLALNEAILRKLRVRRRILEILPCFLLIISPVIVGYIAFRTWWFLADAIEIINSIDDPEQIYHPESDFLDLGFKITIIVTLIIYLISNIFCAIFLIVSWTVG